MISARRLLRMNLGEMTCRGRQAVYKRLERIAAGARSARRLPSLWRAENAYPGGAGSFFAGVEDPRTQRLLAERFPAEQAAIVQGADALCRSRFDLLGYRELSFGEPVDWHLDPISGKRSPLEHWSLLDPLDVERHGDVKVVWELNRHQRLVRLGQAYRATQDERYAEAAGALLARWLEQNPPGLGINWSSSLEVSLRLISWCWALGLLQSAHGLSDVILEIVPDGLARHAHHVARYTSLYSSPNTHLTGEALGLFYAGVLFPEIRGSFAWRELGQRILIDQIERQTTGDGGDELFGGYERYLVERRERRYELVPRPIRRAIGAVATRLPQGTRGRGFLRHLALDYPQRYLDATTLFRREDRQRLLGQPAGAAPPERLEFLRRSRQHWLTSLQALDLNFYLPLDILTKVDRMSMAHSLEARVPLLDHRLVEFAASVPPQLNVRGGTTKYLFRRAIDGLVPPAVLRRPKHGFAVPLERWLRGGLASCTDEILLGDTTRRRGILDPTFVSQVIARHRRGQELDLQLWSMISFELWCRVFLDRAASPPLRPRRESQDRLVRLPAA
jgi:asparagine synthase/heparinase II/III-like protein